MNFFLTGHVLVATRRRAPGSGRADGVVPIQCKDGLQPGLYADFLNGGSVY
jgi:hypothetical protein